MDNKFFPQGRIPSAGRFEFTAATLLGAASAFMFIFVRACAVNGMFGYYAEVDSGPLYLAAGIVTAAGALVTGIAAALSQNGKLPSSISLIGGIIICVGCLLDAVFSVMKRGGFHMNVQTLYFVISVVLALVLAFALYSERNPMKKIIASVALSAIALISAFIPLITGDADWTDVLGSVPTSLCFGVIALICVGYKEGNYERQD